MTATEYILREIEILIERFTQVRARYEYDRMAEVHFVEITPNDVYRFDDAYINWENKIIEGFIEIFPTQNICFISDDSLVRIRNAEFIAEGLFFALPSVSKHLGSVASGVINIAQISASVLDSGEPNTLIEANRGATLLNFMIPEKFDNRLAAA